MKYRTDLNIEKLFFGQEKLTFLVGAGSSVDKPSCLPDGHTMMKAIINYTCADSEKEKLLGLMTSGKLRFEQLVEEIRERLDKNLKIIDLYGQCKNPNIQHFFLADMIKKGHYVMTANFDYLIEYALQQSGVPDEEIIPVITENDFMTYSNPNEWFEKGKKMLYKVHGSPKNIITEEETKKSLVATIKAFGSNKVGLNVFQVEPFKKDLFENISDGRSLIAIGYSGSDDFDIVPTLKVLKNLQNIVWINFLKDNDGNEKIFEIEGNETEEPDKINQILIDIKQTNKSIQLYRVDVNVTKLIERIFEVPGHMSSNTVSINLLDWFTKNIEKSDEITKYGIVQKIYRDFDMYSDALRCLDKIINLAEILKTPSWKAIAFNRKAEIFRKQGKYTQSLNALNNSLNISQKTNDLSEKSFSFHYMGICLRRLEKNQIAKKFFEGSLQIDRQINSLIGQAGSLHYIGGILSDEGKNSEALELHKEALEKYEESGDLEGIAQSCWWLGRTLINQGNYNEALKRLDEALEIDIQLKKVEGRADIHFLIGEIYEKQKDYNMALKNYEDALMLYDQVRAFSKKVRILKNIGRMYVYSLGNYREGLRRYEEALQIEGIIYHDQGNYPEALKRYEEALQIVEQLGDLSRKAKFLNNIGSIYKDQGNYPEALRNYEESFFIINQIGESGSQVAKIIKKNIDSLRDKV